MKLHLILKKIWWDWVEQGCKDVEYRTLNEYWQTRILDKKDKLKSVVFHFGYTGKTLEFPIKDIDVGACPYRNWNGDFIRIHFENNRQMTRYNIDVKANPIDNDFPYEK